MKATINTTINIGDAGIPFDTIIEIEYEQNGLAIFVTHCEEDKSPENMPNWWPEKIQQRVEDYFYEKDISLQVHFVN